MQKNQKGFGAIEAIIVLVIVAILGFVCWYVWKQNHKSTDTKSTSQQTNNDSDARKQAKETDLYAGWLACNDTSEGLTFKYPATWSTEGSTKDNPCGITMPTSASSDGGYVWLRSAGEGSTTSFKVYYNSSVQAKGTYNYVDASYKGETILDVVSLSTPNAPKSLSLVAYASNSYSSSKVAGLVLTDQTYTVGQKVSDSIPFAGSKKNGKALSMTASLATPGNNQSTEYYTLDEYKNHPDYQTVVNLFKSISY